jgi:O-antigen ligase/tetratricopeptide (TPR) repeat protein
MWPALAMAGLIGWQLISPRGSVNPPATWESARLYGAYVGLLLVVSTLPLTRARVARIAACMVAWAVGLAAVGFVRQLGIGSGWPVPQLEASPRLISTFVNPNHQALFFALALFIALGLLLRPSGRGPKGLASPPGPLASLPARVLLVGGTFALALALVLTLSRGGIVSAAAGILAILALAVSGRVRRPALLPVLGVVVGVVAYAGWVGLESVSDRFQAVLREPTSDLRWRIWLGTLGVVADAPVTGIGLGAFQDGFSPYRPAVVPLDRVVDHAHNDFLQLLAETGILGLAISLWGLVAFTVFTVRRWRGRRDPFVRGLVLGGIGAVVAAVAHSLVDFSLRMPGNAVALVVLAGLLPTLVTLHHDGVKERVDLGRHVRLTNSARAASLAVAALGVVVAAIVLVPAGMAGWHHASAAGILRVGRQAHGVPGQRDLTRARDELRAAVAWDPSSPRYWSELAGVSLQLGGRAWTYGMTPDGGRMTGTTARFHVAQPLLAEAYVAYETSLRLRPRASELHEQRGRFLGILEGIRRVLRLEGVTEPIDHRLAPVLDSDRSMVSAAVASFREAIRLNPQHANLHRSLGMFALGVGDELGGREVAQEAIRQALTLRPELLHGVLDELLARRVDGEFLMAAMPPESAILIRLARELEDRAMPQAAAVAFESAVKLASTPTQELTARLAYGRALLERKESSAALEQVRHALVLAPREADVFALLARIHTSRNQGPEAEVALATAVSLAESGPESHRNHLRGELAILLTERGQWERAVTLWRQILRERPNDAWAHFELGRVLDRRGESAEALHEYRMASAVGGDDWRLHRALARAFRDGGYLREAVTSYETARRFHPADGDLGTELGDLYARIGQRDLAIGQYREVLGREPSHAAAERGLARMRTGAGS